MEPDYMIVSKAIFVTRRKFAVDAVANLVPGAENGDGFFYDEGSVIEKVEVAVKVADALGLCARRDAQQREQRKDTENAKIGAHGCGCHFGFLPSYEQNSGENLIAKRRLPSGYWRIGDSSREARGPGAP